MSLTTLMTDSDWNIWSFELKKTQELAEKGFWVKNGFVKECGYFVFFQFNLFELFEFYKKNYLPQIENIDIHIRRYNFNKKKKIQYVKFLRIIGLILELRIVLIFQYLRLQLRSWFFLCVFTLDIVFAWVCRKSSPFHWCQ